MASEIRVDKINSLSGVGTVTLSPTGVDIAGITTAATLRATTGIVTSLTAGSLTSLGAVSGTTGTFSGDISAANSTVTSDLSIADKIVHTGDANTNVRFPAADTITVETGGSERFRIDSSGFMGLGTNNPTDTGGYGQALDITGGSGGAAIYLRASNGDTGQIALGSADLTIRTRQSDPIIFSTNNSERARISSNGKLLVGTTGEAPYNTRLLTVGDTSFADTAIEIRSSSTTGRLYFTDSASAGEGAYQGELTFDHTSGNNRMHTKIGNTTKISVTSDGLTFNGDTAAANALDDYEETSWTPIVAQGIDGGATHVIQRGFAVKIGAFVHFSFLLRFSGTGNGNHFKIGGLPFTTASSPYGSSYNSSGSLGYTNAHFNNSNTQLLFIPNNSTTFEFYNGSPANNSAISGAGSNKDIYGSGHYRTAT